MPSGMYLSARGVGRERAEGRATGEEPGDRPQPVRAHTCWVAGLALGLAFPPCEMGVIKYLLSCLTVRVKSTEMRD